MVRGAEASLIYDLHRGGTLKVPTLMHDVFLEFKEKSIEEVKAHFEHEYDEGIDLFLNRLIELELVFETSEKDAFPPMDFNNWDYPLRVSNAILEVPENNSYNLLAAIDELNGLGCAHLQLRLIEAGEYTFSDFEKIIEHLKKSRVKLVELILPHTLFESREKLILFFNRNLRLSNVIFHSAPENKIMENENPLSKGRVSFTRQNLMANQSDYVSPKTMFYNIRFYAEAFAHNVALNRKVCITKDGFFKNYLSHKKTFGNINQTSIKELIETENYKVKWFLSNDKIEGCRDCQFKYACFSNSDIEKRDGKYFKTEHCGFDPYENKWIQTAAS